MDNLNDIEDIRLIMRKVGEMTNDSTFNRDKIVKRLSSLGSWIYLKSGFGLRDVIESQISSLTSPLNAQSKDHAVKGAEILLNSKKINQWEFDSFIDLLQTRRLVYVDDEGNVDPNGKWSLVNKINTNYRQIAEILTDVLFMSMESGQQAPMEILSTLDSSASNDQIKNVLLKYKEYMPSTFKKYLNPTDYLKYVDVISRTTNTGEVTENKVVNILTNKGYSVVWQGGNGDFVDMRFGVDMIVVNHDNQTISVQVKTTKDQFDRFIMDKSKGKYRSVDVVCYLDDNKLIAKRF